MSSECRIPKNLLPPLAVVYTVVVVHSIRRSEGEGLIHTRDLTTYNRQHINSRDEGKTYTKPLQEDSKVASRS